MDLHAAVNHWAPDGVDTVTPFDCLVAQEEGIPDDPEPELDLAGDAQRLWEFLIPGEPWLPDIAVRAFEAAEILEVPLPWKACKDPWGAGTKANAQCELKRLQILGRTTMRYSCGILERGNKVAKFLIELAARDATATKYVHRLVMFCHLLSRGDLLLHADGSELSGLMGRHRRGVMVPLRSQCEELLGVRGMAGLSDAIRQQIRARRLGNTSRMGGRWGGNESGSW